jgi:hypothetical protein
MLGTGGSAEIGLLGRARGSSTRERVSREIKDAGAFGGSTGFCVKDGVNQLLKTKL